MSSCVNGAGRSPRRSNEKLQQDVKCGKVPGRPGVNSPRSEDGVLPVHHIPVITGIVSLVIVCVIKILSKTSEFFHCYPQRLG